MGRQINYFMDFETFCLLAQKALDLGAVIIPGSRTTAPQYRDISCITRERTRYLFHFPEHVNDSVQSGTFSGAFENAVIEAGFSVIKGRTIYRERMYISTGYFDSDGLWIPRPKQMDCIYTDLVCFAKKHMRYKVCTGRSGKDYITPAFDELVEHKHHVLADF